MYFPGWNFARAYGTGTPRQRPYNGGNTARHPARLGTPTKLGCAPQRQPKNGGQVAQVPHGISRLPLSEGGSGP